jgi:hypothetical protein
MVFGKQVVVGAVEAVKVDVNVEVRVNVKVDARVEVEVGGEK